MRHNEQHYRAAIEEIERHRQDTETSKLGHWAAARRYEIVNKFYLGLPATVLSIVVAWFISDSTKDILANSSRPSLFVHTIPVIISLMASILSGMSTFLNLNDLVTRHRTAAENLHALWRNCINWRTDFPDVKFCDEAVKAARSYRERLNDINKDAPQIPKWAWRSAQRQRDDGSVSYDKEKIPS